MSLFSDVLPVFSIWPVYNLMSLISLLHLAISSHASHDQISFPLICFLGIFPFWWPYSYSSTYVPWVGEDRDFPFVFLVVCLIANSAVLISWAFPKYWSFCPLVYWLLLPLVLVPSVVDDPLVNHALSKCSEHSVGHHSSIDVSLEEWRAVSSM